MSEWTSPLLPPDDPDWKEVHYEIDEGLIKIFGRCPYQMVFNSDKERKAFGFLKSYNIESAKKEAIELYKNPPKFVRIEIKNRKTWKHVV